jgi:hypothetical protein
MSFFSRTKPKIKKIRKIIIDDYTFILVSKILTTGRTFVNIHSYNNDNLEIILENFWVYPSNSELGTWRFCSSLDAMFYKGNYKIYEDNEDKKNVFKLTTTNDYIYDYIQQTMIHIELQKFIDKNLSKIDTYENKKSTYPSEWKNKPLCLNINTNLKIKNMIDDQSRAIKESPFIEFNQKTHCGDTISSIEESDFFKTLSDFSTEFKELYYIEEAPELIYTFKKIFENIITINGNINSITLRRKVNITGSNTNIIKLYYLTIKLEKITAASAHTQNIINICKKNVHFMPICLIPIDATCNSIGLYTKYIPCGAYICKLFDYSSMHNMQCTPSEIKHGRCTPTYSYIGTRYDNMFPFDILRENAVCSTEGQGEDEDEDIEECGADGVCTIANDWSVSKIIGNNVTMCNVLGTCAVVALGAAKLYGYIGGKKTRKNGKGKSKKDKSKGKNSKRLKSKRFRK